MDDLKEKVIYFLKRAINKTIWSYDRMSRSKKIKEPEFDFAKYYAACKQAISNLESLLKLYEKNTTLEDKNSDTGKNLKAMIDEACIRIKKDNKKYK